jgi:hypothetical protein
MLHPFTACGPQTSSAKGSSAMEKKKKQPEWEQKSWHMDLEQIYTN